MSISHEHNCDDFKRFYSRLTKGDKRTNAQINNETTQGYLQKPVNNYKKGVYNLKCCCQSHTLHRESDKFKIANKPDDPSLAKKDIFGNPPDGEIEI